jgi:hypothetical protein
MNPATNGPLSPWSRALLLSAVLALACAEKNAPAHPPAPRIEAVDATPVGAAPPFVEPWDSRGPLAPGETYALDGEIRLMSVDEARGRGLLDVDLSDQWAPFIFSESNGQGRVGGAGLRPAEPERGKDWKPSQGFHGDGPNKPNAYRTTYVALANDRASPEELLMETRQGELAALSAAGISAEKGAAESPQGRRAIAEAKRAVRVQRDRNYLEAYGIPPTLSVLLGRIEEDRAKKCFGEVDMEGLAGFPGTVTFQSREQARRDFGEAMSDASWVEKLLAGDKSAADATTGKVQRSLADGQTQPGDERDGLLVKLAKEDKRTAARVERYRRGQARLRAIRAVQARLACEGLLSARTKFVPGQFDLATHHALAAWERKNDIFGWGFLGGETSTALQRPQMELHLDTFRRIVMERIADGAAILEDGSASTSKKSASYRDADGKEHKVPNLIGDYADALLAALNIRSPDDLATFLGRVGHDGLARLHVAFKAPPLPPYYGKHMEISVEIDRGDVWYDFPWDEDGKPIAQPRVNFPTLTVLVDWQRQKIPLVQWRTTIGSWRSEVAAGKVYYKYKNSDVGPRIWKDIVASPVWIPPESTPAKDLLTRKTLDRDVGPVTVVNSDVMGPGFQSAYGLVMAIHHRKGASTLYDNQIRTHGSVDYTSIARRYSHGCHRLVNSRAVRLFDFILHRRPFERVGNQPVNLRRHFSVDDQEYEYVIDTRGYYYELKQPIRVMVKQGQIKGKIKRPIDAFVAKPGEVEESDPSEER